MVCVCVLEVEGSGDKTIKKKTYEDFEGRKAQEILMFIQTFLHFVKKEMFVDKFRAVQEQTGAMGFKTQRRKAAY